MPTVQPTIEQLMAKIAELEAAKAAAEKKAQENSAYSVKIGRSGTISVSGFGRYPLSPYKDQWRALNRLMPSIMKFIDEHETEIDERVNNPVGDNSPNPSTSFKLKMAA